MTGLLGPLLSPCFAEDLLARTLFSPRPFQVRRPSCSGLLASPRPTALWPAGLLPFARCRRGREPSSALRASTPLRHPRQRPEPSRTGRLLVAPRHLRGSRKRRLLRRPPRRRGSTRRRKVDHPKGAAEGSQTFLSAITGSAQVPIPKSGFFYQELDKLEALRLRPRRIEIRQVHLHHLRKPPLHPGPMGQLRRRWRVRSCRLGCL